MIKFFRKIRQKMLTENKFSKYLLYAIGEIVLVVIGILIALSINNWNINRISDKEITAYMVSLKENLKKDTLNFSTEIKNYKKKIDIKKNLLLLSNYEKTPIDSLFLLIDTGYGISLPITNTFDKITNSGITQISKNDSLSQKIYEYYTTNLANFNTLMDWEVGATSSEAEYWIYDQNSYELKLNNEIPQFQDEVTGRVNLIKLITEPKGRNYLNSDYHRKKRILAGYKRMKKIAVELIVEIEKELNSK
jgi:Family of unknown function (DUF6090)